MMVSSLLQCNGEKENCSPIMFKPISANIQKIPLAQLKNLLGFHLTDQELGLINTYNITHIH